MGRLTPQRPDRNCAAQSVLTWAQSRVFLRTELERKRNAARTTVRSNAPRLRERRPLQGRESGKGGN
jgi:hypothetical protein